jgi:Baseplate J-like protein
VIDQMNCNGTSNCLCGCCAGTSVQTPQVPDNLPGLPAISYRAGTWTTFKESMLARLSSSDYPALAGLKTRSDDDFSIAFLDAAAMVLDILTFYQERLANESYLRTATQLRSLIELSRLIGYQPSPGVSAAVYVAFTLKTTPGQAPNPAAAAITIPQGTQTQTVPAQGQTPQTFETFADIQAKPDWNALPVQTDAPWVPVVAAGPSQLYLSGTSTQLQQGDSLLFLGPGRESFDPTSTGPPSDQWDVVVLTSVQVDNVRSLTKVTWAQKLPHESGNTSGTTPWPSAKVFAFRQKAALFGSNAPSPYVFVSPRSSASDPQTSLPTLISISGSTWSWNDYYIQSSTQIDLDATYPKIVAGSWFALCAAGQGTGDNIAQLFRVVQAATVSTVSLPSSFGLSGKVTELVADYNDPNLGGSSSPFPLARTAAWAQSDQLVVADQPLDYPLYGIVLDLEDLRPDLLNVQGVAVSGTQQKLCVAAEGLWFVLADGTNVSLTPGDIVTLAGPIPLASDGTVPDWDSFTGSLTFTVQDSNGRPGTVLATFSNFRLAASSTTDPVVSEYAVVSSVNGVTKPYPHTQLALYSSLANCYDRTTTTVNANVALATQGSSVSEILGSGNASTPDQSFTLKQSPLTYIQASTPTGRQTTLEVQVNGADWTEVPSLYNQPPTARVFATLNQSGVATAYTGDGVEGAVLPTGQNNIQANYRIGLGSAGNVAAGALSTLLDRPIGVSGVTNPQAATGGQDPDSIDDIRTNAPLTVLTLGRAVSITDYQNYAASFAGISQAYAIWIPSGPARGVFLTVAGAGGAALPGGNPTLSKLVTSLKNYGNPLVPITPKSFLETLFGFSANLAFDPAYDPTAVQAQVTETLSQTFSFAQRTFGQGVSTDELAAVIQGVPGVVGVNVFGLTTTGTSSAGDLAGMPGGFSIANLNAWRSQPVNLPRPYSDSPTRICPYIPVPSLTAVPYPAEILVLDPDPNNVTFGPLS